MSGDPLRDQLNARPIPLTDAELEQEATITERDKVEDVTFWKEHGSPLTNNLRNAKPE